MFALNENINISELTQQYSRQQRLLIENVLSLDAAKGLSEYLSNMQEWNLAFKVQDKHYDVSASGFDNLNAIERNEFIQAITSSAEKCFGYMYKSCPVYDLVQSRECPKYLESFFEYVNSSEFVTFLKNVTGFQNIEFLDIQATCYSAGHFLTSHDDNVEGKNRLAAYVFNLSPDWDAEWGGNLTFYDENGSIDDVFVPKFNSLSLFTVGKQHAVSKVAEHLKQSRFAITGWLRFK